MQTEQAQFDGLNDKEKTKQAVKVIKSKFAGKVIGIDNRVFVNGISTSEYAHPVKNIDSDIRDAKMRASTELDNLMDAGANFRTAPDGQDGHTHRAAVGDFRYFDTIFKVGNEYYEGTINIIPVAKGLLLKDITKIKNITQDIDSSYGKIRSLPSCVMLLWKAYHKLLQLSRAKISWHRKKFHHDERQQWENADRGTGGIFQEQQGSGRKRQSESRLSRNGRGLHRV